MRYLAERCPGHVIVFPAWFPQLTARRDLLEPIYRVRLEHNTVAGADEMVVYRLVGCRLTQWGPRTGPQPPKRSSRPGEAGALLETGVLP